MIIVVVVVFSFISSRIRSVYTKNEKTDAHLSNISSQAKKAKKQPKKLLETPEGQRAYQYWLKHNVTKAENYVQYLDTPEGYIQY